MSKDIRSYFFKSNGSSTNKSKPESPQSKKRTRRVIESDDENDDNLIVIKKKPKEVPTASKSEKRKPEIIVDVENFFGNNPVQQKKQTITAISSEPKKEKSTSNKQKKNGKKKNELSFENDEELEASLLQTDDEQLLLSEKKKFEDKNSEVEKAPKKNAKPILNTPKKEYENIKKTPKKEIKEKITTPKKENEDKKKTPKKENKQKINTPIKENENKKKTPKREENLELISNKTPKREEIKADGSLLNSETKRRNAEAYQKFLNRSGPKNPGSKQVPKGTPTCLQGLTFVITGVLDSLEREEATQLIQKCGGRVTSSVSKKTDYIVVGEEPGVSKIQKAENFGTKKLNEDELLDLIRCKSEGKSGQKENDSFVQGTPEKTSKYFEKGTPKKRVKNLEEVKNEASISKKFKSEKNEPEVNVSLVSKTKGAEEYNTKKTEKSGLVEIEKTSGDMLWVDKYRPKSTKNIVGQMGEKSNVKKLIKWLQNWHKNHSTKGAKKLSRPASWAQNDDGAYFKAALLSGPPGVGKTTTVHLVCEELGLDIIEFNASDTRSKRLLQEEVSELLSSKSIRGFFQGNGECYDKHVLVMDEVDGMAGNEDRGGIQELIQLIKNTKVPIVGICNDRNHPKMRSLVNYCFDLRFQRPRMEQIKGAMKSICFKEKLEISGEALEELIVASNHDVRQVLHNLSLLASGHSSLTLEEAKKKSQQAKKPLNLSPWDVVRKVFSASDQEKMSFTDKTDLFFQDYSLGPLFVQDTYLRVKPYKAKDEKKKLELISKAADSLVLGDVIEKAIRSQNAWSLLPVQAVFSSVMPGHYMSGHVQGQIQFPVWLGKNSRSNKFERLLQDLHSSLKINITGTKQSINLDYLNILKNSIVKPLIDEGSQGVQNSLEFMINYHLTREDLDSLLELSAWPGFKELFSQVDSKVKAALTRALNKEGQMVVSMKKTSKIKGDADNFDLEEGEDTEEAENDNIDLDPMIKVGKPKTKKNVEEKSKAKEEKKKGSSKKEPKKGKK